MGVGIVLVLSVIVAIMIIPTSYSEEWDDNHRYMSYEEKKQKELDRLEFEYAGKENNEGGPPTEELIDFQQLRLDAIRDMEYGVIELDEVIEIKISEVKAQNEVIAKEQKAVATAKELLKKEWGAPQPDTTKLNLENKKLLKLNNELGELVEQKDLVLKEIETKKMIYDIQKHDAKLIGVKLSSTCIKLAKLNIESSCPTYEDLYNLDNSITEVSGEFSFHDGYFHREKSGYQDTYRAYDNDDTIRVLVDPPFNEAIRIKMITIEPNLGYYADKGWATKLVNGERLLAKDRIIMNCNTATITAEKYNLLVPDTIFTFRNGCENSEIDDFETFEMTKTEIDIWSSPNIQYSQWLLEMKDKCKELC